MRGRLSLLLLAFLLFAGTVRSDFTLVQNTCLPQTPNIVFSTIGIAFLALTVSFDVVAFAYIIGKIFPETKISDWVKSEFWEMAKSALLIIGIYAIIIFLGNFSTIITSPTLVNTATNGALETPFSTLANSACTYLGSEQSYITQTFSYLLGLNGGLTVLDSLQVGAYFPYPPLPIFPVIFEFGFVMSPYQNTMLATSKPGTWQSMLNDMINIIAFPVELVIAMQLYAIPILFVLGIGIMIPIGLVLRAFPFVRGIGGTMVAIGIGVSIIYPATLVLFNYPITAALQGSVFGSFGNSACGTGDLVCGFINWLVSLVSSAFSSLYGLYDALGSFGTIYPALNGILFYSNYLLLQFVLFILDLSIVYSLSDNIARILGGTIRLELGGKLKLV